MLSLGELVVLRLVEEDRFADALDVDEGMKCLAVLIRNNVAFKRYVLYTHVESNGLCVICNRLWPCEELKSLSDMYRA